MIIYIEYKLIKEIKEDKHCVYCVNSNEKKYNTFINLLSIYGYEINDLHIIIYDKGYLIIEEMNIKIIGYHEIKDNK